MQKTPSSPTLHAIAIRFLTQLDIHQPTIKQVHAMENVLSEIGMVIFKPLVNKRLSKQETICLGWIAQGKSRRQIAQLMEVKIDTVKSYQDRLRNKLDCSTLAQAVYEGMRFGFLKPHL